MKNFLIISALIVGLLNNSISKLPSAKQKKNVSQREYDSLKEIDSRYAEKLCDYQRNLLRSNVDNQIDYSKIFFKYLILDSLVQKNIEKKFRNRDFSSFLFPKKSSQQGFIGKNKQRISIHFDSAYKVQNSSKYNVTGKSKVKNNITPFNGEVNFFYCFREQYYEPGCDLLENTYHFIFRYRFLENKEYRHSGIFEGIGDFIVVVFPKKLEDFVCEGYGNRNFVGTWTDYNNNQPKTCIWGDYILPFMGDLAIANDGGEMMLNLKYLKNGWQGKEPIDTNSASPEFNGNKYLFYYPDETEKWWK